MNIPQPACYATNEKEWRAWLRKNHKKEKKVWLIKKKRHTGKPALSHRDSMEQAICFGWIDTIVKRIDENSYTRCFVARTDKSRWSNATLGYAERLIKEGKMTKAGLKRYEEGKTKPVIDHGLSKNPRMPKEMKHELEKHAKKNWKSLPPSSKRYYIWWILRAKREETIQKRIKEVVSRVRLNKKWGE